ncbi:MAG: cytochrome c biogenesis CcdA family protein, partial [Acidimicrobiales bacterium]
MITDLVALFGVGVASFLAPCLVPLLPAYLGLIAGESPAGSSRTVGATLLFVGGLTVVFAGFVAAGLAGSSLTGVQDGIQRVVVLGVLLATGLYRHLTSYLARLSPAIGGDGERPER